MYKCPNKDCSNKNLYSDQWISSHYADGKACTHCRFCDTLLEEVEKQKERQTAMINTAGCTPSSNRFTH